MREFIYPNILEPKLAPTHQNCSSCPPLTLNLRTGRTKFSMYTAVDSRRIMLRIKSYLDKCARGLNVCKTSPSNLVLNLAGQTSENCSIFQDFPSFSSLFVPIFSGNR